MRATGIAAAVAAVALTAAACGSADEPDGSTDAASDAPAVAADDRVVEGEGTFPTTVEHRYGSTTVEAEPATVVSVGLTEQDVLLQLGVVPAAVTEWYGEQPSATWASTSVSRADSATAGGDRRPPPPRAASREHAACTRSRSASSVRAAATRRRSECTARTSSREAAS